MANQCRRHTTHTTTISGRTASLSCMNAHRALAQHLHKTLKSSRTGDDVAHLSIEVSGCRQRTQCAGNQFHDLRRGKAAKRRRVASSRHITNGGQHSGQRTSRFVCCNSLMSAGTTPLYISATTCCLGPLASMHRAGPAPSCAGDTTCHSTRKTRRCSATRVGVMKATHQLSVPGVWVA